MQRTAIILACFFICTNSFAQQYPFVHYTPKDGLINSRVKKAYQDSKGRMYFLTYGGLSVYDGARFRNYTTQNGLPINIVNDILEIGNDSLLVATNSANMNLLVKGRMELFKTENNFSPLVNQFYRHENGQIYLSSDFGLFHLEKNKINKLNIPRLSSRDEQPNVGNISGIGNYLVISTNEMNYNQGLFVYDIKNDRICDSLTNIRAYLVVKDGENRIWLSTSRQLLIVDSEELKKGRLSLLPPDKGYQHTKGYSTINIAFGKKMAWFVYRNEEYRNSELRRIDEDGNMLRLNMPGQMTAAYIQNIFVDRENNIWLCNDGEGVFKIVRSPLQIIEKPFGGSGEGQASYVYYNNGITWYSTISKKLYKSFSNKVQSFTSSLDWSPFIFYDDGKNLLANDGHHIYKASLQHQSGIINFQKIISLNDSDVFNSKLLVDPNGMIIASQKSGLGIWLNNKLIDHKPIDYREHIEDLFIDNNNKLWLVKRSLGIDVYSLHPDNISNYLQLDFSIPANQMPGSVRSFVIDKKGLIWIGTRDHGLSGYILNDKKLEKLFHFHTGNGLSDNFVTSLACDSLNNIITGTQSGLDLILFNPDNSYRIENLSRNSNLFAYINATWADAVLSYAMTNSGVVLKITPTSTDIKDQSPQLLLEELKVNAKTILSTQSSFNYKENNISFLVAAPSFIDEKQIRYTYLLQGSGNDRWSDTSAANFIINLTNLSPGSYVLKVKSFFPSDAYPPAELSYPFEITPPWWQTWWFRSVAAVLIIGLLITGIRFFYRRKLEKQQAIEKERTRIATDMHDDLGAGLSRIKFLSENMKMNKGNDEALMEDIKKISTYSNEMAEKMGEIVWALNQKNDTVADLVAFTRSYAQEYLSGQNIHCNVDTPLDLPSIFITGEMRQHVFLSVKECLHNIVKHAEASQVYFTIKLDAGIEITIQDNGKGINWNALRPFSNGIQNIQKRMNEINGKVVFKNEVGTKVILSVPYKV